MSRFFFPTRYSRLAPSAAEADDPGYSQLLDSPASPQPAAAGGPSKHWTTTTTTTNTNVDKSAARTIWAGAFDALASNTSNIWRQDAAAAHDPHAHAAFPGAAAAASRRQQRMAASASASAERDWSRGREARKPAAKKSPRVGAAGAACAARAEYDGACDDSVLDGHRRRKRSSSSKGGVDCSPTAGRPRERRYADGGGDADADADEGPRRVGLGMCTTYSLGDAVPDCALEEDEEDDGVPARSGGRYDDWEDRERHYDVLEEDYMQKSRMSPTVGASANGTVAGRAGGWLREWYGKGRQ